jgi:hypothetical protein
MRGEDLGRHEGGAKGGRLTFVRNYAYISDRKWAYGARKWLE